MSTTTRDRLEEALAVLVLAAFLVLTILA